MSGCPQQSGSRVPDDDCQQLLLLLSAATSDSMARKRPTAAAATVTGHECAPPKRRAPVTNNSSSNNSQLQPFCLPDPFLHQLQGEDEEENRSPGHKKQYRSSDARWRRNLKQAFRLLRDITFPSYATVPIAGKNMRRDILDFVYKAVQKLEDDVALLLDINVVRDEFVKMEVRGRFTDDHEHIMAIAAARSRKRKPDTIMRSPFTPSFIISSAAISQQEVAAAAESIAIVDEDDQSEYLAQEQSDVFGIEPFKTSTPRKDSGAVIECQARRSKAKFAAPKRSDNVRRRLNMDEADENMIVGVHSGGGDGPQHMEQAVDEYLETSFSQLLHMSQGGSIYCEAPVKVEGSFSDGPGSDMPVACDVEVESTTYIAL